MKHLSSILRQGLIIGLVVFLSTVFVFAQQSRGTLRGSVKDELGASIVGATITVIDASGTAKTTVTNGEGVYTLGGLAPGKYFVVAAAPGFAPSEQTEIDLAAGQRQSLDLTLTSHD